MTDTTTTQFTTPPAGWMPPPPAPKTAWYTRKVVQISAAAVLGLTIGAASAGGSNTSVDATPAASSSDSAEIEALRGDLSEAQSAAKTAGDKATAAEARADAAQKETASLKGQLAAAKKAPAAAPAAPKPAAPAPAEAGALSDGDWTTTAPKIEDDGLGDFGATSRVTNNSDESKTGVFTLTFFKGGELVGSAQGSASDVGPGDTATVSYVSTDAFTTGVDKIDFQVDMDY